LSVGYFRALYRGADGFAN